MSDDSAARWSYPAPAVAPLVVVAGSLMIDLVMRVARRPAAGETVLGSEFAIFAGGKGLNQAIAARRLGALVRLIGRVGDDDFGRRLRSTLKREQIDDAAVSTDAAAGTGVAAPVIDTAGENSIIAVPRANLSLTAEQVRDAAPLMAGAAALLVQQEIPPAAALAAMELGRAAGALVILNAAPVAEGYAALLPAADVIVVNEHEASALSGRTVTSHTEASSAAATIRSFAQQSVIVTLGSAGCVVDAPGLRAHVPALTVTAVDSTGAGDAFCGALAVRMAQGADLRAAMRWANAAGACAVTVRGAEPSLPRRPQIEQLLGAL